MSSEFYGDYGSKKEPNVGTHQLFSFLTTEANELVRPIHAKAMPVVLESEELHQAWLNAPAGEIEALQARVLLTGALEIVPEDEAAQYTGGYLK